VVYIRKQICTRYWNVNPHRPEIRKIIHAASLVAGGGIVAFPTETVYGLGADALNPRAVQKIFTAKGRPADNPLIVHVAYFWQLREVVRELPFKARVLIQRFWPGPLTLVVPKRAEVPDIVTAGLDTVAVRMPAHRVAFQLIRAARYPVAAPSANVSGRPSPTAARHVLRGLYGRIEGVLDGGPSMVGVESTVLDMTGSTPVILRPGGVTREQLEGIIGPVEVAPSLQHQASENVPRSPGMKYRHYSPSGEIYLVQGKDDKVVRRILELTEQWQKNGRKVGILCSRETFPYYRRSETKADLIESLGSRKDLKTVAGKLYGALHRCDLEKINIIFVEAFPSRDVGLAVMNRLLKAAGNRVVKA